MLRWLPAPFKIPLVLGLLILNTLFWCLPLYVAALAKLLIPLPAWRRACSQWVLRLAEGWAATAAQIYHHTQATRWRIDGLEQLDYTSSYLVVANHISAVDVLVLQRVFNRRIPFLKFFAKRELLWFPLLGLAWWALDIPFVRRYSQEEQARDPSLRGRDLAMARQWCERYRGTPTAIASYPEGTRFSVAKHARQASPYRYLLRPKAGGLAFVLGVMGDQLDKMLDVTVVFPDGHTGFWDFLAGRIAEIVVHIETLPVPARFVGGDYVNDPAYREEVQAWTRALWERKDALIARLLAAEVDAPGDV